MIHLIVGAHSAPHGLRAGPFSIVRLSQGKLEPDSCLDDVHELPPEHTRDFRVVFKSGVTAAFEGSRGEHSSWYGPFTDFGTTSGIAMADERKFATYDANTEMWRHESTGQTWRILILMEEGLFMRQTLQSSG